MLTNEGDRRMSNDPTHTRPARHVFYSTTRTIIILFYSNLKLRTISHISSNLLHQMLILNYAETSFIDFPILTPNLYPKRS